MRQLTRSFRRDDRGSIAIIFGLSLLPLVTLAGAAHDFAGIASARTALQVKLDTIALQSVSGTGSSSVIADDILRQLKAPEPIDVAIVEKDGGVAVSARMRVDLPFSGIIGFSHVYIDAHAAAVPGGSGAPICVLALSETADAAIDFAGNTTFATSGCVVQSNSRSATSIAQRGSATAASDLFCAAGRVSGSLQGEVVENCRAKPDPFAKVEAPRDRACRFSSSGDTSLGPNRSKTFSPGVYCGKLDIKGTATLLPGVYVLTEGLDVGSQASITGNGVTLYVTGQYSEIKINGGGAIDLSAPTQGPTEGILLWHDRQADGGKAVQINGHANVRLKGAIYAPRHQITINGTAGFGDANTFVPMIADRFAFSGNSTVQSHVKDMKTVVPIATMASEPYLVR